MRFFTFVLCFSIATATGVAQAGGDIPVDYKPALDFIGKSQFVVSKATVNPFELAGCLVFRKEGKVDEYLNVLPESIKKMLKPQNLTDNVYRTMVTREQAVKVGILGFIGFSSSEKSLLEVSINERWKLEGPGFLGDEKLKELVFQIGKIYVDQGFQVLYNPTIQYSTLVTSEFQESSADVRATLTYVDGNGKKYAQSSNYTQRELISIAPFNITPLIKAWNPATTAISKLIITNPQIESMLNDRSSSQSDNVIKLNSADLSNLRQSSKQITSKEFKSRVLE